MEEVWRNISECSPYEVSDCGRVRRYHGNNDYHYLKPYDNNRGYLLVKLSHDGKKSAIAVHRLVAKTFVPNPNNKPQVDHINGNRTDNRALNLRWCTNDENLNYPNRKKSRKKLSLFVENANKVIPLGMVSSEMVRSLKSNNILCVKLPNYKSCLSAKGVVAYVRRTYPRKDGMSYTCKIDWDSNTVIIQVVDQKNANKKNSKEGNLV